MIIPRCARQVVEYVLPREGTSEQRCGLRRPLTPDAYGPFCLWMD
jgi:hypothetical protein